MEWHSNKDDIITSNNDITSNSDITNSSSNTSESNTSESDTSNSDITSESDTSESDSFESSVVVLGKSPSLINPYIKSSAPSPTFSPRERFHKN